ncbi:ATP-dependent DNA helicase sgs1, partial [Mortierella antarctica]
VLNFSRTQKPLAFVKKFSIKLANAKVPHIILSSDNSDAIDNHTIRGIADSDFRAVFMMPEIIFGEGKMSNLVKGLWCNDHWRKKLLAIVIDEVHCVDKWGDKFCPQYAHLSELCTLLPRVPFVGLMAMLTADALTWTMDKLFLSEANVLHVQDVHMNVCLELHTQPKDQMKGLNCLLNKEKTIVHFEKISVLLNVLQFLQDKRPDLQGKVDVYYSTLTPIYKDKVMCNFMESKIHVLLATEAAGMGCDIPDVVQVIQYSFPRDMSSLEQRFGQAA